VRQTAARIQKLKTGVIIFPLPCRWARPKKARQVVKLSTERKLRSCKWTVISAIPRTGGEEAIRRRMLPSVLSCMQAVADLAGPLIRVPTRSEAVVKLAFNRRRFIVLHQRQSALRGVGCSFL
jgi:hypothetical protein